MTIEEAINFLKGYLDEEVYTEKCRNAHKMAIKVLEQEPCEDCVNRHTVLNTLFYKSDNNCEVVLNKELQDRIKALPSVIPQQKVGKWIRIDKDKLKCSECEVIHYIAQYPQSANINYCPNCGTKMESEEKE